MTVREREDERSEESIASVDELRKTIASGFSFVRSREVNASVASVTMEECIAQAIVAIEDDRSDIRPGLINKITNLKESVLGAVDQALRMSEDAFESRNQGSANTEEEVEE